MGAVGVISLSTERQIRLRFGIPAVQSLDKRILPVNGKFEISRSICKSLMLQHTFTSTCMAYYGHRQVLVVHVLYSMLFGIAVWMSVIVVLIQHSWSCVVGGRKSRTV